MASLRVLLVDDNPEFLRSAAECLSAEPDVELVGTASDGYEAIGLARELRPDCVLIDLIMPNMNGLTATRAMRAGSLAPRIIVVTLYDHPANRQAALAAGADGLIAKTMFADQIRELLGGAA